MREGAPEHSFDHLGLGQGECQGKQPFRDRDQHSWFLLTHRASRGWSKIQKSDDCFADNL